MTPFTTTETIFAAWLFLLTLGVLALWARSIVGDPRIDGLRGHVDELQRIALPKRRRVRVKPSKADIPIALVPTEPGERIDLTTPLAERVGISTFDGPVTIEPGFPVAGVGGTLSEDGGVSPTFRGTPKKADSNEPGSAA